MSLYRSPHRPLSDHPGRLGLAKHRRPSTPGCLEPTARNIGSRSACNHSAQDSAVRHTTMVNCDNVNRYSSITSSPHVGVWWEIAAEFIFSVYCVLGQFSASMRRSAMGTEWCHGATVVQDHWNYQRKSFHLMWMLKIGLVVTWSTSEMKNRLKSRHLCGTLY